MRRARRSSTFRTPAEFKDGAYPGAVNMPLALLPLKLKELEPRTAPIVLYCASATCFLAKVDVDVPYAAGYDGRLYAPLLQLAEQLALVPGMISVWFIIMSSSICLVKSVLFEVVDGLRHPGHVVELPAVIGVAHLPAFGFRAQRVAD